VAQSGLSSLGETGSNEAQRAATPLGEKRRMLRRVIPVLWGIPLIGSAESARLSVIKVLKLTNIHRFVKNKPVPSFPV